MPTPSGLVAFYMLGLSFSLLQPNGFLAEGQMYTARHYPTKAAREAMEPELEREWVKRDRAAGVKTNYANAICMAVFSEAQAQAVLKASDERQQALFARAGEQREAELQQQRAFDAEQDEENRLTAENEAEEQATQPSAPTRPYTSSFWTMAINCPTASLPKASSTKSITSPQLRNARRLWGGSSRLAYRKYPEKWCRLRDSNTRPHYYDDVFFQ